MLKYYNNKNYILTRDFINLFKINKDRIRYALEKFDLKITLSGTELKKFKCNNNIVKDYSTSMYILNIDTCRKLLLFFKINNKFNNDLLDYTFNIYKKNNFVLEELKDFFKD